MSSLMGTCPAEATEAHILREAVKRHPDVPISKNSQKILALYPDGIQSASFPKKALYKGISEKELRSTPDKKWLH